MQYNILRNSVNRESKSLRSRYYKNNVQSMKTCNPGKWWQKTFELLGLPINRSESFNLLAEDQCGGDMNALVNDMNTFFQSVSAHLTPIDNSVQQELIGSDQLIISLKEVELKLMSTNIIKATGPDDLPNWILRDLSCTIAPPICAIFNQSLRDCKLPTEWKQANVTPIPKVHSPRSIQSDVRPISLTPTISKYLESFIGSYILETIKDKLDPNQYGAIKGLSTTHALIDLLHHLHEIIHHGNTARICFIDYLKAFDLIDHNILIKKFQKLDLDPGIINWLRDYLSNREQRVKLDREVSEWLKLCGSVPQGSWLGPLCFIIFMNDMKLHDKVLTHKYIDDITLTESISATNKGYLQEAVHTVKEWSDNNNMRLNETQTKEMLISLKKNAIETQPLLINKKAIERVTHFKILGVWLSDTLSWSHHVHHMTSRASPRLYYIKQLKRSGLTREDLLVYYKTMIRPILEYACPVWHAGLTSGESDLLEQTQKRALKIIYPDLPYVESLDSAHLELLRVRRERLSKQFFVNMCKSDSKLNYLLEKRNPSTHNTRNPPTYHCPIPKNERYKGSFVIHNLLDLM